MVRRSIDIELIAEKSKRHTTFTKRRKGLMKKTEEFCRISDSTALFVTFSSAGNCYGMGHPDVHSVLQRYDVQSSAAEAGTSAAAERVHDGEVEEELTDMEKRISDAVESERWAEAVRGLELQELDELYEEVKKIRAEVEARGRKLAAEQGGDSRRGR